MTADGPIPVARELHKEASFIHEQAQIALNKVALM